MKFFNFKHLSQVEESYVQHLKFGICAGLYLIFLGIVSLVHAVVPFFLSRVPDRLFKFFLTWSAPRLQRVENVLRNKNLE